MPEDVEYGQCYNCGGDNLQVTGFATADAGPKAPAHKAIDYGCWDCGAHYVKHYKFREFERAEKR